MKTANALNRFQRTFGAVLCGAAFLALTPTFAHQNEHGKTGAHGRMMQDPAARLAESKAALNLTPAQLPVWNAYAEFATRTAAQRKQIFTNAKANNLPREQVKEQMRALFTQNAAEGKATRKALYDVLSPEQREIAHQLRKAQFHGKHGGEGHRG